MKVHMHNNAVVGELEFTDFGYVVTGVNIEEIYVCAFLLINKIASGGGVIGLSFSGQDVLVMCEARKVREIVAEKGFESEYGIINYIEHLSLIMKNALINLNNNINFNSTSKVMSLFRRCDVIIDDSRNWYYF